MNANQELYEGMVMIDMQAYVAWEVYTMSGFGDLFKSVTVFSPLYEAFDEDLILPRSSDIIII